MTGRPLAVGRTTLIAHSLLDARTVLGAIGSAMLPRVAMIAIALLLILVIFPAVLGAAGIPVVAAG